MTSQEALDHIKQRIQVNTDSIKETHEALYVIQKLVDKLTPQKPMPEGQDEQDYILCPSCKNPVGAVDDYLDENKSNKFCHNCGQALDWSNV